MATPTIAPKPAVKKPGEPKHLKITTIPLDGVTIRWKDARGEPQSITSERLSRVLEWVAEDLPIWDGDPTTWTSAARGLTTVLQHVGETDLNGAALRDALWSLGNAIEDYLLRIEACSGRAALKEAVIELAAGAKKVEVA